MPTVGKHANGANNYTDCGRYCDLCQVRVNMKLPPSTENRVTGAIRGETAAMHGKHATVMSMGKHTPGVKLRKHHGNCKHG